MEINGLPINKERRLSPEWSKSQRKRAHLAYRTASIVVTDRMALYRPEGQVLALFPFLCRCLQIAYSPRGVFE